jgi:hypothetical protein
LDFLDSFLTSPISDFTEVRLLGEALIFAATEAGVQADRWTDLTKEIAAFRDFANAQKGGFVSIVTIFFGRDRYCNDN